MNDPVYSSVGELASAILRGEGSAVELVEAHLARIADRNPALNAVVTLDEEGALRQAREADDALARGEVWGPLHGVPLTLKDGHSTAGMRTTAGYLPLSEYVPKEDGAVSRRLKAAGGIVIGKTNVPELLLNVQADNEIFGFTRNPWNTDRVPGGSSGGACAALAAGMTPLEVGSDLAGSIRIPAHCCGVFGLKPTERRVSLAGHIPDLPDRPRAIRVMAVVGPLARSVEDLYLGFRILAGPDGCDHEVAPVPVGDMPEVNLRDLRIAWAPTFPGIPVASEIGQALERLAAELDRAGAHVEECLPKVDFDEQVRLQGKLTSLLIDAFEPTAEGSDPLQLADYFRVLDRRDALIGEWDRFFDDWDVLLCPVVMVTAFPHCPKGMPLSVDGEEVDYWTILNHCRPFNLTGHPVVTLPVSKDAEGMPIGIQAVGRRWEDERLLAMASRLVEVTGPFDRPPGY